MNIIVVTNPELGWDCVVAVYDQDTTEDDITSQHGDNVILHYQSVSTLSSRQSEDDSSINNVSAANNNYMRLLFMNGEWTWEHYEDVFN